VRRETGKEYMVKVHDDKRVASYVDPEPCAIGREAGGEASVGACTGRPLSRDISIRSADAVVQAEGKMGSGDNRKPSPDSAWS
jgi:hypothetical protein